MLYSASGDPASNSFNEMLQRLESKRAIDIREAPQIKKREKGGIFPKGGAPPPLPPVWEPHVCEKKIMVYFALGDPKQN